MEFRIAAILLVIGILASISVTFFTFLNLSAPEIVEMRMHYNVSNVMGFNVDTSALYYGTIPPTGTGSRKIHIENSDNYTKRGAIRFFGEAARWAHTENASFTLEPHEKITIPILVSVPEDAPFGSYSGLVRIYLTKI